MEHVSHTNPVTVMAKYAKGFTLVELIVVLAIISLLASIILAAINDARDKARVARGKQFYSGLTHAIGLNLIGEWKFENLGSGTADDTSGNNNPGVLNGDAVQVDASACGLGLGGCVDLDGDFDFVRTLTTAGLNPNTGTVCAWFNSRTGVPPGSGQFVFIRGNSDVGNKNRIYLGLKNGAIQPFFGADDDPVPFTAGPIMADKWHQFCAAWDNGNYISYLDGVISSEGTYNASQMANPNPPFFTFGSYSYVGGANKNFFNGFIDEVRIYTTTITAQEAAALYAEDNAKRQLAGVGIK